MKVRRGTAMAWRTYSSQRSSPWSSWSEAAKMTNLKEYLPSSTCIITHRSEVPSCLVLHTKCSTPGIRRSVSYQSSWAWCCPRCFDSNRVASRTRATKRTVRGFSAIETLASPTRSVLSAHSRATSRSQVRLIIRRSKERGPEIRPQAVKWLVRRPSTARSDTSTRAHWCSSVAKSVKPPTCSTKWLMCRRSSAWPSKSAARIEWPRREPRVARLSRLRASRRPESSQRQAMIRAAWTMGLTLILSRILEAAILAVICPRTIGVRIWWVMGRSIRRLASKASLPKWWPSQVENPPQANLTKTVVGVLSVKKEMHVLWHFLAQKMQSLRNLRRKRRVCLRRVVMAIRVRRTCLRMSMRECWIRCSMSWCRTELRNSIQCQLRLPSLRRRKLCLSHQ